MRVQLIDMQARLRSLNEISALYLLHLATQDYLFYGVIMVKLRYFCRCQLVLNILQRLFSFSINRYTQYIFLLYFLLHY